MLSYKQLLSQQNLNNAFISSTNTAQQSVQGNFAVNGGQMTLKTSYITDNASSSYLRIDPQGNQIIIYDGVNNQQLSVYSSSGSENTYITTINQASNQSYGLLDVANATSISSLNIGTSSGKPVQFGSGGIYINSNLNRIQDTGSSDGIGLNITHWGNIHQVIDSDNNDNNTRYFTWRKGSTNYSGSTELMRLTESGSLGIGVVPNATLDVNGNMRVSGNSSTTTMSGNGLYLVSGSTQASINIDSANELKIQCNNIAMVLSSSGIYLNGNSIDVNGNATFNGGALNGTYNVLDDYNGNATFASNVAIGASSVSSYRLDVHGDINLSSTLKVSGTSVIDSSRNISANSTTVTGNFYFGATAPIGTNKFVIADTAGNGNSAVNIYSYGVSPGSIYLGRATGTYASPTAISSGNVIGRIHAISYTGSNAWSSTSTGIKITATENHTSTAVLGTNLSFLTTPNGTAGGLERMRIEHNGNIGINNTSPSYLLDVSGDINTSTSYKIGGTTAIDSSMNGTFSSLGIGNTNEIWGRSSDHKLYINKRNDSGDTTTSYMNTYIGDGKGNVILGVYGGTTSSVGISKFPLANVLLDVAGYISSDSGYKIAGYAVIDSSGNIKGNTGSSITLLPGTTAPTVGSSYLYFQSKYNTGYNVSSISTDPLGMFYFQTTPSGASAKTLLTIDNTGLVNAISGYQVNGTTVIDSNRNLVNVNVNGATSVASSNGEFGVGAGTTGNVINYSATSGNYQLNTYFRSISGETVISAVASWNDAGGSQSYTIYSGNPTVGSWIGDPLFFNVTGGYITLSVTCIGQHPSYTSASLVKM